MNLIIWLVVGGVLGWLASIVMHTDNQQGPNPNVIVGIVGAMLWWLDPIAPLSAPGRSIRVISSPPALLVSFLGAVILLAIVNGFRRLRAR